MPLPKPKQLKRKSKAALSLADRVAAVDARVAAEPVPFDARDSVRDRLFALLMQRVDVLQEARAEYVEIMAALMRRPADARALAGPLQRSLKTMLQRAGAGTSPAHVAALVLVYAAVIAAWRNDTSADLSRTMNTCDKALGILETLAGKDKTR